MVKTLQHPFFKETRYNIAKHTLSPKRKNSIITIIEGVSNRTGRDFVKSSWFDTTGCYKE